MRIEWVPLDEILRWPRNPKKHDIPAIKASIQRFGFRQLLARDDRTGKLVAGHGRLEALQSLRAEGAPLPKYLQAKDGVWMAPVLAGMEFANDEEAEAYVVADNRLVELGGWDEDALAAILSDASVELDGLLGTGFSDAEVDAIVQSANAPKPKPPKPPTPLAETADSVLGEVYMLGHHRLMCGDASNPEHVEKLVGNSIISLVVTDPPYNIASENKGVAANVSAAHAELMDSDWDKGFDPETVFGMFAHYTLALDASVYIFTSHHLFGWYIEWMKGWADHSSFCVWCLSGSTWLYARTQKGEQPQQLRDLVRLNPQSVELWTGKRWTQVVAWTPNKTAGKRRPLQIVLRSGEHIACTAEHRWVLRDGTELRADQLMPGMVLKHTTLPLPPVAGTPPQDVFDSDIAWLIGLYLAEGSDLKTDQGLRFAGHRKETARFDRLQRIAFRWGGSVSRHPDGENGCDDHLYSQALHGLVRSYVLGDSARTKRFSRLLWRHGNHFLEAVLDGYLEGDTHHDKDNGRWRFGFTRNSRLVVDFRTIAARLGFSLRLKKGIATGFGKDWKVYKGQLRKEVSAHHSNKADTEILGIRGAAHGTYWDVTVRDESSLFALASGVVTHNCKPDPMPSLMKRHWTWDAELVTYATRGKHTFNFPEEGHLPSTWNISKSLGIKNRIHPTQKPVECFARPIRHSSNVGDTVLDLFAGSGPCLIAADQERRTALLMEASPQRCDLIRKRWDAYLSEK